MRSPIGTPALRALASLTLSLSLTLTLTLAARAAAQEPHPARCGDGIPAGEARGYVPLPRGDVFCPLVADPKAIQSFVSYLRGDAREFATNVGSVGVGDAFGLFRVGGREPGDGVQLSIAGGVFAQFDVAAPSYDLLNADYLVGLPLTVRRGALSARLRVYHQSSHLGDEFLLRDDAPARENLSFEAAELIVSGDAGPLRAYAGGEWFFDRDPAGLPRSLGHAGLELRPGGAVRFGTVGRVRLLAAADGKVVRGSGWDPAVSVRAGVEVGRGRETPGAPGRRWSLLYEFYDGRSPYGQFHQDDIRLSGIGFHFTP